jgi:hypothetical protein
MKRAVAVCAAVLLCAGRVRAVDHDRPAGHPYVLAGNRIAFTTWYFVRPGQPDWQDDQGQSHYAERAAFDRDALHYVYADRPYGIRLVAEPAERRGPIIRRERDWERVGLGPITLMADEGKLRLWAHCDWGERGFHPCYLESTDGRIWSRPELGQVEFEGSKANNLIEARIGSVFKDPSAPPEARYKSVWHGKFDSMEQFEAYKDKHPWSMMATEMDAGKVHAIRGATSPDGIRWTELPEPVGVEASDTQIVAYFDVRLDRYVMYTRTYQLGPRAPGYPPPSPSMYQLQARRSIGRTESATFDHFPPAQTILEPTLDMAPSDQIYTNCRTTIPGAPDHHVFFPTVFHLASDTTSVEMYGSYDGRLLQRIPGGPVLETAGDGEWDGGCVFASPNLIEMPDGSWVLPYTGYDRPHKYPHANVPYEVGLAVWPKGRLVAIRADDVGGFTTPAFIAPGRRLRINALTERAGSIRVEVADLNGETIPGRSFDDCVDIRGDQYRTIVRWKTGDDLGVAAGEPVALRFRMTMASLYSLDFE